MESLKRSRAEAGLDVSSMHGDLSLDHVKPPSLDSDDSLATDDRSSHGSRPSTPQPKAGKKTRGRVKINMEFIDNKLRRYTTFSKRKSGIMKKAHELATLTGTQVMLLVASETGHVYTFATRKLQPILSSEAGKQLIQTCLNSPDPGEVTVSTNTSHDEQRMSAQGFEEPELSCAPAEDSKEAVLQKTYHILNRISSQQDVDHHSVSENYQSRSHVPVNFVSMNDADISKSSAIHFPAAQALTLMPAGTGTTHFDPPPLQLPPNASNVSMHMLPVAHQPSQTAPNVSLSDHVQGRQVDPSRITLLNSYTTLQRTGVPPLLVAGANPLQMPQTQVTWLGQPNYGNNKKTTR